MCPILTKGSNQQLPQCCRMQPTESTGEPQTPPEGTPPAASSHTTTSPTRLQSTRHKLTPAETNQPSAARKNCLTTNRRSPAGQVRRPTGGWGRCSEVALHEVPGPLRTCVGERWCAAACSASRRERPSRASTVPRDAPRRVTAMSNKSTRTLPVTSKATPSVSLDPCGKSMLGDCLRASRPAPPARHERFPSRNRDRPFPLLSDSGVEVSVPVARSRG